MKKHRLSCFACVALTLAMIGYPTISKADILYSTIDMPCDTSSNTVNIKAGFASEKMWSTRSEHPRSGLYFLDDLVSSSDVSTPSKPITCTTANGQTIGFAAYHGDEPKHDSLVMFVNGVRSPTSNYKLDDAWELAVKAVDQEQYTVTFCPKHPSIAFRAENFPVDGKKRCEVSVIANGAVENSIIIEP